MISSTLETERALGFLSLNLHWHKFTGKYFCGAIIKISMQLSTP